MGSVLYSIPLFILVYGVWLPWHNEMLQKTCNVVTESNGGDKSAKKA
jgi:hypothetical protein